MKSFRVIFLSLMIVLSVSFLFPCAYGETATDQESEVKLWLVLRLRDYATDMPISNISITATISTPWGEQDVGPTFTNKTGMIQVFAGKVSRLDSSEPSRLVNLDLPNNYTLIKVHDSFMEDVEYTAEYAANNTKYTEMSITLAENNLKNQTFIEGNLWVLKGKLIRVSDRDPITGEKRTLTIKPAVKAVIQKGNRSQYEGYYFFPLNYDVIMIDEPELRTQQAYPRLRVMVNRNTTLINWMHHAASEYAKRETLQVSKDVSWLSSSGFSLDREIEEYQAIEKLLKRVLDLYKKGEYGPALGGARISARRLNSLETWLSNLRSYALYTSASICLFAYGLASILPGFVFEEPSENRIRLVGKALIFSLLMLTFSLTHPSLKMTYAIIIENLIRATTPNVDLLISLLGCFIVGSLTYFFITLISIKKTPMTDLALQLGVRSLKRRLSRTILTLITITIIVSSAIVFVNISASRATRIKGSWRGANVSGVLIQPDVNIAPLSEYDVNWTREQEWCKDIGYREEIRRIEMRGDSQILRSGMIVVGERSVVVDIVGVDPGFMERSYNISKYVRGFWQDFSIGKTVVIIPTSYEISTNDYAQLIVGEQPISRGVPGPMEKRALGSFRVIGKFDPSALSKLTKIDNTPLFKEPLNLVLVPIKAIKDPSIVISEATIITGEKADPVDVAEELAYTLGIATIANKGGLAMRIEWSLEFSIAGFVPYLFPLVIAGLMVYITMASIYEERKREFTTLATLGLDPRNTFQVFIIEAFLLGLMGTFFGFFGSYILVIASFYLANLTGMYEIPTLSLSYAHWSMQAILVALFTGVVMVFLGGYIPAVRTQGLSLMGRVKRRQLIGELVSDGNVTHFTLPIKETVQNGEMLYSYVRETIGKFNPSLVDPHSIKGEIYGDGSFKVSFFAVGSGMSVFIPCEVKGAREGESLSSVIEFPTGYKDYEKMREIVRDLEEYMIGFSAWKETQLKMKIVREAPRKKKTLEEILAEVKDVIAQIKDCNKKVKMLDTQKGQLSEEVYNEFRQKYVNIVEEKSKGLRSTAIGLEPYTSQLQDEIKKMEVEIERITTSYNLGEIGEEEYVKTGGPLQGRLALLKSKVKELEEVSEFLKMPSRLS